jgi:hypothetical protein
MAKKHQPLLDYIYSVIDGLDKSGANTQKYKEYYDGLSEEEFKKVFKEFLLDPTERFFIELDHFEDNLTVEEINTAAQTANVLVEDYLVLPHISEDKDNPYVSNEKVFIGYAPQRRVQQSLSVKNHLSTSSDKRNPKTNQVIDEDKNARISNSEMYQLFVQNSPNTLAEFYGPRADDLVMQNEMLYQIQRKGSVSLDELPSSPENKTSLNYMNFLLLAAGYESDLVDPNGMLPITISRGGKIYND